MEALAAWLKQIIVVVLLATFIDLLLPNRTMQRYVKLVVSLFILMTILTPVMKLFGTDANLRMLAAAVEGWTLAGENTGSVSDGASVSPQRHTMPVLGELLAEGEAMRARQSEQSISLLETKISEMVVEHVRIQHGVANAQANATVTITAEGFPAIEAIRIRIRAGAADEADSVVDAVDAAGASDSRVFEPSRAEAVRPIEPVVIDPIQIGAGRRESRPAAPPSRNGGTEPAAIAASVAKAWNIDASRVSVVIEGG